MKTLLSTIYIILTSSLVLFSQESRLITRTIVPPSWNRVPVANAGDIKGGLHSVSELTELDNIDSKFRTEGMLVYVSNTQQLFQFQSNDWEEILLNYKSENKPNSPKSGQLYFNPNNKKYEYFDGTVWKSMAEDEEAKPVTSIDMDLAEAPGRNGVFVNQSNSTPQGAPLAIDESGNYSIADALNPDQATAIAIVSSDTNYLHYGYIRNEAWNFTPGSKVYLGGQKVVDNPILVGGSTSQVLGFAITSNLIFFNPDISQGSSTSITLNIGPSGDQIINRSGLGQTLTAIESPQADSREWFYSNSSEGPFVNSLNNNSLTYTPKKSDFGSIGVKHIAFKAKYGSVEKLSPPVKVLFKVYKMSPERQTTPVNQDGRIISGTIAPFPDNNTTEWYYSRTQGGPYEYNLNNSNFFHTPNFNEEGDYYIISKSKFSGIEVTSNEVLVKVTNLAIAPTDGQFIREDEAIEPIWIQTGTRADFYYGTSPDGPFNNLAAASVDNLNITNLPVGVNYVVAKQRGQVSESVKITVLPKGINADRQVIRRANASNTFEYASEFSTNQISWFYGNYESVQNTPMGNGNPFGVQIARTGDFFIKAVAEIGGEEITSSPLGIKVVAIDLVSDDDIVIKNSETSTQAIEISEITDDKTAVWVYGTGDGHFNNPLPAPTDNKAFFPSFNTNGVYYIAAKANYSGVDVMSDSVKVVVIDPQLSSYAPMVVKPNHKGSRINFIGVEAASEQVWQFSSDNINWLNFTGQNPDFIEPKFSLTGQYYIRGAARFGTQWYYTEKVDVLCLDVRLEDNSTQFVRQYQRSKVHKVIIQPENISNDIEWFYGTDYSSMSKINTSEFRERFRTYGVHNVYARVKYNGAYCHSDTAQIVCHGLAINGPRNQTIGIGGRIRFSATEEPTGTDSEWGVVKPDGTIETGIRVTPYTFNENGRYKITYSSTIFGYRITDTAYVESPRFTLSPAGPLYISQGSPSPSFTASGGSGIYDVHINPVPYMKTSDPLIRDAVNPIDNINTNTIGRRYVSVRDGALFSNEVELNIVNNYISLGRGLPAISEPMSIKPNDPSGPSLYAKVEFLGNLNNIQWYYGESEDNINTPFTGFGSDGLNFRPELDEGIYYVKYKIEYDEGAVVESKNTLIIVVQNTNLVGNLEQVLAPGQDGLSVTLQGTIPNLVGYKWFYKNPEINDGNEVELSETSATFTPNFPNKSEHFYTVYVNSVYLGGVEVRTDSFKVAVPIIVVDPPDFQIGTPPYTGNPLHAEVKPAISDPVISWYFATGAFAVETTDPLGSPVSGAENTDVLTPSVEAWFPYKFYQASINTSHGSWPRIVSNKVGIGSVVLVEISGVWQYSNGYIPKNAEEYKRPPRPGYEAATVDGLYKVDFDGEGGAPVLDIYCNMTTNGGGWMLASSGEASSERDDRYSVVSTFWREAGPLTNLTSITVTGKNEVYDQYSGSEIMLSTYDNGVYSNYISANLPGNNTTALVDIVSGVWVTNNSNDGVPRLTLDENVQSSGTVFNYGKIGILKWDGQGELGDGGMFVGRDGESDYNTAEGVIGSESKYAFFSGIGLRIYSLWIK